MEHITQHLAALEKDPAMSSRQAAIAKLRGLGLSDFGMALLGMPDARFPRLSSFLPAMATEDTQKKWTGAAGQTPLSQSVSFMRSLSANYAELVGRSLHGRRILDFGCGYGRLLRLAAFYSDDVFGVDPWDESIRLCRQSRIENVALSDYLPTTLPVPADFDLAFAFSVFTHLSPRAARTSLAALRRHVKTGGILCITVRPIEYWRSICGSWPENQLAAMESMHHTTGFAYKAHNREPIDGDITYGDASVALEWLRGAAEGWKIEAVDRSLDDFVQRYVFLRAA